MIIQTFKSGVLHNNNYVVIDEKTKQAILIDCTQPNPEIIQFLTEQKAELKYILLTHGHFDHMLGVDYFQNAYRIPAYLHENDKDLLKKMEVFLNLINLPPVPPPKITHFFNSKTPFFLGDIPITVFETPGHSMGGCCFLIQDHLFSGDTLFGGTHGRTDLLGSDEQKMKKSLSMLFQVLGDHVKVYPGHGHTTTIGQERGLYT